MAVAQISRSLGVSLASNPGFVLRIDAAKAWDAAVKKFGKKVLLTGAWRSNATQVEIFTDRYQVRAWPSRGPFGDVRWWGGRRYVRVHGAAAAVPGTSNHGGGVAVDVKTSRQAGDLDHDKAVVFTSWTDPDRTAFLKVAAEFGWADDEGRSVGELWHLTYYPARDKRRGTTSVSTTTKLRVPKKLPTLNSRTSNGNFQELWQWFLIEHKYLGGKADGFGGPRTEKATKNFQTAHGLKPDGIVGADTWASATLGLKAGSKGFDVRILEHILGFTGDALDYTFGPAVGVRLRELQRWLGVKADGVIGRGTVTALRKKV